MKFFKLLKKELRELFTFQSIISMLAGVLAFIVLGNVMSGIGENISKKMGSAVVYDMDQTAYTKQCLESLDGLTIHQISGDSPIDLIAKAKAFDEHTSVLVIPKGFTDGIKNGVPQELQIVNGMQSFSLLNGSDDSAGSAAKALNSYIFESSIKEALTADAASFYKSPTTIAETTVVKDKYTSISSNLLASFSMQQSIIIPIIVFLLVTFATQLNAASIANEKNDKTLETLLSAPVSRLAVISSKMCASGIFSLIMAGVYMIGFSGYMSGMVGGVSGGTVPADFSQGVSVALAELGLQIGAFDFFLIGIQLFLTILITLTLSMMLGALAKDVKSAQSLTMPIMMITMVPYFITMFMDVNQLPLAAKILVNAIPFTHTFTATSNLMFGNNEIFIFGMIYQLVILVAVLFLAVRVFSTDKIFTMTLEFGKKKKKKIADTNK